MGTEELINQIGLLSYSGMGLLAFVAKFLVVIPEEIVLLVLGYVAGSPAIDIYVLAPIVFLCAFLSDLLIYVLARRKSGFINKIYDRFLAPHFANKMNWIENNMQKSLFISRFLMQFRILGPILAGRMHFPLKKFLQINFFASLIYIPLYLILGYYFRGRIEAIFSGIGVFRNVLITIVVLIVIFAIMKTLRNKFFNSKTTNQNES